MQGPQINQCRGKCENHGFALVTLYVISSPRNTVPTLGPITRTYTMDPEVLRAESWGIPPLSPETSPALGG